MGGEILHVAARVADEAVIGKANGEAVGRPEEGIVGADRVALDLVPGKAGGAPQVPAEGIRLEGGAVAIDIEIVGRGEPAFRRRSGGKGAVVLKAVADDGKEGARDAGGLVRPAMGEIAGKPGEQARQIGPAQEKRTVGVEQHARGLGGQAGYGDGDHGAGSEHAAIAMRGAFAGRAMVDKRDVMSVAGQPERGGHADDSGADDGNPQSLAVALLHCSPPRQIDMIVMRAGLIVNDLSTNCDYNSGNTLPDVDADGCKDRRH